MKKLICVLLGVCLLAALFSGCIAKFKCDLCGEEKFGTKYSEELLDEKYEYCSDCKEKLDEMEEELGERLPFFTF